ncbi:MAG: DsbE family thiol:disulfide interchange protein [Pseudomonadota bacterium]
MQLPVKRVETAETAEGSKLWQLMALSCSVFVLVFVLYLIVMDPRRDARNVASVAVGDLAPETDVPPLDGVTRSDGTTMPRFTSDLLQGQLSLVEVWASWCDYCRSQHPLLVELGKDNRVQIIGLNISDSPENAIQFLETLGNPFDAIGLDPAGSAAADWGAYGVPVNYLVNADGVIVWKRVGVLTPEVMEATLMPAIEEHATAK